jgi:hypothetical protein
MQVALTVDGDELTGCELHREARLAEWPCRPDLAAKAFEVGNQHVAVFVARLDDQTRARRRS